MKYFLSNIVRDTASSGRKRKTIQTSPIKCAKSRQFEELCFDKSEVGVGYGTLY